MAKRDIGDRSISQFLPVLPNIDITQKITSVMQSYTLAEACNPQGTVFNQAAVEPVLLTDKSQPSHVIMSADAYQRLIERLIELEDMLLGDSAKSALS
ncbi:type II toxin-antitoxin system Phd/YefM family antitoxin [Microcoleus vaginatus]|uniref:type II toxin-antitoxin system Phd/YefM family antitoxin n=1 Tax=Microcoleus vaginatus TaxID=119532 RepID=UPI0032A44B7A